MIPSYALKRVRYARKRLQVTLEEIEHLKESEFPYPQSKAALWNLEAFFKRRLAEIKAFDDQKTEDVTIVTQACSISLYSLFMYLPILGFILRSTNVRNAFEVYRPLLKLAREVLEPLIPEKNRRTQIILSSEWDYSPFMYSALPDLPNFLLIGLPAPESGNPLLIPLAGHELGHSLWQQKNCDAEFIPIIANKIIQCIRDRRQEYKDIFQIEEDLESLTALPTWNKAVPWASKLAEEVFCDCVGVRLFGNSFLHAFAYLLAPNTGIERAPFYPDLHKRAQYLIEASNEYGLDPIPNYSELFELESEPELTAGDRFLLDIIDEVLTRIVNSLIIKAHELVPAQVAAHPTRKNAVNPEKEAPTPDELKRILDRFKFVVPAERVSCLADLINAAWSAFLEEDFWRDIPNIGDEENRDTILKELILKNIEILEIDQIRMESQSAQSGEDSRAS